MRSGVKRTTATPTTDCLQIEAAPCLRYGTYGEMRKNEFSIYPHMLAKTLITICRSYRRVSRASTDPSPSASPLTARAATGPVWPPVVAA